MWIKKEDKKKNKDSAQDYKAWHIVTSIVFSRGLKTKAKDKLENIASILELPIEDTNKVIVEHIQTHLNITLSLANDPHFAGLFPTVHKATNMLYKDSRAYSSHLTIPKWYIVCR